MFCERPCVGWLVQVGAEYRGKFGSSSGTPPKQERAGFFAHAAFAVRVKILAAIEWAGMLVFGVAVLGANTGATVCVAR